MEETPHIKNPNARGEIKKTPIVMAIISNEAFKGTPQYRSIRELAEEFNVLPKSIYTYRTRLGLRKVIQVASNGQRHTEWSPIPPDLQKMLPPKRNTEGLMQTYTRAAATTEDLVRSLDHEGIISPIDRLKMLSRMIRVGSPMIKIAAIKAIEDLSKTTEGRVGPPAPLTEEERVVRLSRLMLAVGEQTTRSALNVSFPSQEPQETLPTDSGGLPDNGGLPTEEVPDLQVSHEPIISGP